MWLVDPLYRLFVLRVLLSGSEAVRRIGVVGQRLMSPPKKVDKFGRCRGWRCCCRCS